MTRIKHQVQEAVLAAVICVSLCLAGGCTVDISVERGDDQLIDGFGQIAYGVVDIVEYFD